MKKYLLAIPTVLAAVLSGTLVSSCSDDHRETASQSSSKESSVCPSGYREFNHVDYVGERGYPKTDLEKFMYGLESDEGIYCNTVTDEMLFNAGRQVISDHPQLCTAKNPQKNAKSSASDPWGALELIDTWDPAVLDSAVDQWMAATDGGPATASYTSSGFDSVETREFISRKAVMISALGFCHYPWQRQRDYLG